MGLSIRKSFKLNKNTKFNLSRSGLSISTGVKGARFVLPVISKRKPIFYAQKRVAGVDFRYIKSFNKTTRKNTQPMEKQTEKYTFDDFDSPEDAMDFDDYLDQPMTENGHSSYPQSDPFEFTPEKLPEEPWKVNWWVFGFLVFVTWFLIGMAGWFYLLIKKNKKTEKNVKEWERQLSEVEKRNKENEQILTSQREQAQQIIDEGIRFLSTNKVNAKKSLEEFISYERELEREKELVNGFYVPKSKVREVKDFFNYIDTLRLQSKYAGTIVSCNDCDHVWTVSKECGLPDNCPSCRKDSVLLKKIKSFEKQKKIDLSSINEKEINNLSEQLQQLELMVKYVRVVEMYAGIKSLDRTDDAFKEINQLKPLLKDLKDRIIQQLSKLNIENY